MLVKKPRREDYPFTLDGDIPFMIAERTYYKARAELAIAALEKALESRHPEDYLTSALKELKDNE